MSLQLTETLKHLRRERKKQYVADIPEWVFTNNVGNLNDAKNWRSRVFKKLLKKQKFGVFVYTI